MLDEGVNINARDENGNTLFILACQQGNKGMCKFLMRRRCDTDLQVMNTSIEIETHIHRR
jgi:ankyrin repeat protein